MSATIGSTLSCLLSLVRRHTRGGTSSESAEGGCVHSVREGPGETGHPITADGGAKRTPKSVPRLKT